MSAELESKVASLPVWRGTPQLAPLTGGVSNVSFLVTDGSGKYVARMGGDHPVHHVSRERELIASRAAHAAGFSPEVVYAEPGVMILRFIAAHRYTEGDVRANTLRCAELLARCHADLVRRITGPPAIFWVFHVLRDYFAGLERISHKMAPELPRWRAILAKLEAAQLPLPVIFGHHDLLATNFLDDGNKIWLIDWEYGAFGTAMFDLANLASNNALGRMEEHVLLETYFGKPPGEALWRSFDAMKIASGLREAVWAVMSGLYVKAPGIDYDAYAEEFINRFEAGLAAYEHKYGKL